MTYNVKNLPIQTHYKEPTCGVVAVNANWSCNYHHNIWYRPWRQRSPM